MSESLKKMLRRLEFDKIISRLAGYAYSELGKERIYRLEPLSKMEEITRLHNETKEAVLLLRLEPNADLGGWYDVRRPLRRASREAILDGASLFKIGSTLAAIRRIKSFFSERSQTYPLLHRQLSHMVIHSGLERRILKSIKPDGEVDDQASTRLAGLRRRIQETQLDVKSYLERTIRNPSYQKYLQDPIVTVREGRYVIPVKQEYRSQVPGLVHDQSASGATLFIEPMEVVEKNNEIRRLEAAEKQEIQKILADLSKETSKVAEDILASLDVLGYLDFTMAKARYAYDTDAVPPRLVSEPVVEVRRARHPLIKGRVVPIDFCLGKNFDILVLTGPNTGGKTVALKTVGLIVLMAQSGLHIPAEECEVGMFDGVYADIGDEQSIEDSLSTFSSHIRNIVGILESVGKRSLVLIDELGTGTDPVEGAALAQAILEKLYRQGAKVVATTHFSELKHFATTRDRVENASVEFDRFTLEPTFQLVIGRPGRSYAFDIAYRLGLGQDIIALSKKFLTEEQQKADELLRKLEQEQQEAQRAREEAERIRQEAVQTRDYYQKELSNLLARKQKIIERANEEANELLRRVKRESEDIIKTLRQDMKNMSNRDREQVIQEVRERLKSLRPVVKKNRVRTVPPQSLKEGDNVFIPRFAQHGTVVASPKDGQVQVQVGVLKVNIPVDEVEKSVEDHVENIKHPAGMVMQKAREFKNRLDLRGMRVEDALVELDKYLDDALLSNISPVYLVHGKGTGALREAVCRYLKGDSRVKSFRLGKQEEGGMGVTVAELK
ncbi:MAG: endonuclease MutS2 [Peptococcaceae bacterium]|nr:endonuclease MutS2 [Peptococcaceae bacterium]